MSPKGKTPGGEHTTLRAWEEAGYEYSAGIVEGLIGKANKWDDYTGGQYL